MVEQYTESAERNKPKKGSVVPSGWETDAALWPKPSEIQRDDLGRAGSPGAYGGVRVTVGQARKEPAPTADEAESQPLPTLPRNPEMEPMPPEKKGKLAAARTE